MKRYEMHEMLGYPFNILHRSFMIFYVVFNIKAEVEGFRRKSSTDL